MSITTILILMSASLLVANENMIKLDEGEPILLSQSMDEEIEEFKDEMKEMKKEIKEDVKGRKTVKWEFKFGEDESDETTPFLGVYLKDLTFKKMYELRYDQTYGVLITGVVRNGPAFKAGLMKDDIIMEFGGEKVKYEDHLIRLRNSHNVGDKVEVKYFRDGEVRTTTLILGSREHKYTKEGEVIKPSKKKLSAGYGGGSWIPVWYVPDFDDVNEIISQLEFPTLSKNGLFMNGGGGKGPIGKGLFIGGMGAGCGITRKKDVTLSDSTRVTRKMKYDIGYGGVTLTKRIPFSRKLVSLVELMLGWGRTTLEILQKDGNYNWDIEGDLDTSDHNYYVKMEKKFIALHPKVGLMYRITSWLGVRATAGYIYTYSFKPDWTANEDFDVVGSKNTKFSGYTFTIGPWFGF